MSPASYCTGRCSGHSPLSWVTLVENEASGELELLLPPPGLTELSVAGWRVSLVWGHQELGTPC